MIIVNKALTVAKITAINTNSIEEIEASGAIKLTTPDKVTYLYSDMSVIIVRPGNLVSVTKRTPILTEVKFGEYPLVADYTNF